MFWGFSYCLYGTLLVSIFIPLAENILYMTLFVVHLVGFWFMAQDMECLGAREECAYCCCGGRGVVYQCWLDPVALWCSILLRLCWVFPPTAESELLKSPIIIVVLSISPFTYIYFYLMWMEVLFFFFFFGFL